VRTLTSPSFDLSGENVQRFVKFRYAYARMTTAASADQFRVLASSDCGRTWVELLKRNNTTNPKLSTIGDTPSDIVAGTFIPEPNQYRMDSLSFSNLPGAGNNISIRFEMTSDKGNFLYLDNVSIGGITTSLSASSRSLAGVKIVPNPGDGNSLLITGLNGGDYAHAELVEISGKVLASYVFPAGENRGVKMNDAFGQQKEGLYFIRIRSFEGVQVIRWENKN